MRVCQPAPGRRHGDMLLCTLALLVLLSMHPVCWSKRPGRRPGLLHASHLIFEVSKVSHCDVPGNAIRILKVHTGMANKVDFSLDVEFNITRSVRAIDSFLIQITKCRELVSSNTCEIFHTWRFENNPCKGFNDPLALWACPVNAMKPRPDCPFKKGTYAVQNLTLGSEFMGNWPFPYEGNVWRVRLGLLETKTLFHMCTDIEAHVHRVRDN
ncbi:uncharacterized protein LOC113204013 isoform X1 [Frankliniella occidentalis]|uniref:Uncharacterized protein LOC113204013 isoform X1 n=1 Tax=Frankliniella occidentalis TaxID=133901 RepID=A0A9C6XB93_FRAOC|nr:uncharacterized protein LOC113204013 isoform X1 [Frankliniella occidentalis]